MISNELSKRIDLKQYRFINPTYYVVASNVFQLKIWFFLFILGRQIKISGSNQGMRPQLEYLVLKNARRSQY